MDMRFFKFLGKHMFLVDFTKLLYQIMILNSFSPQIIKKSLTWNIISKIILWQWVYNDKGYWFEVVEAIE